MIPAGAPGVPSDVSGTSTSTSITVSFTAPDDNGNPIILYQYEFVGGDLDDVHARPAPARI